ncbi:MAG: class 1 fructose-bisphosphatase [Leptospiraceae bacterium]|nr:class 1 fructose-bisphosphatase [Leptospiraceae bacterium]MCZ8239086.1 class 1 fructose-bisphosphatase [Leptospiraceae bacterium]MCZ8345184.1 class 1 fructose-bisphosphatase [Leptospiraceae bacterium]PJE04324.1 MAG: class 1 fructose-bisphosphatase [Leptospira sp.]
MQVKPQDNLISLSQFLIEEQLKLPYATGGFTALMSHLVYAAKVVTREVRKAGLLDNILGSNSTQNVQGETQMKLDEYADRIFTNALSICGHLCVMASEEQEDLIHIPEGYKCGKYTIAIDPLDGSSNIDSNVSIGTIFSIHRRQDIEAKTPGTKEDLLQPGHKQRCAGYIIYGSSTMLVLSTGNGVVGFTLDPSCGEFLLSHPNMKMPESGSIYSVNEGNYNYWSPEFQNYIKHIKSIEDDKPRSARYIGSLVADFHRNLLKGGIFLYPNDTKSNKFPNGKLRLLYESAPMAFIAEQAGGMAVTIKGERILDLHPKELHERSTLIVGSKKDVEQFLNFI